MVLGLISGTSAATAQSPSDSAVFSGLTSVAVGVDVDPDLERYISADRLKTVIELELRRSGIQVVDLQADATRDGNLIFALLAIPEESSSGRAVGFSVARLVDFYQGATLIRNSQFVVVSTWQDHSAHYWGINRVQQAAETAARSAVEAFVNRYMASNRF
jgi:hypothetical protein